jgi:hypothetical protein
VHGDRTYVLALSRNETGVETRRLVASSPAGEAWSLAQASGERFTDFVVHPSGELTLGVERTADASDTYDLVRLSADGAEIRRAPLDRPTTIPAGDLASSLPASPFRMVGVQPGSVITGWLPWLELEARGEDLVVAVLSHVDRSDGTLIELVDGVIALRWSEGGYVEEWARIVDGMHLPIAVAWQYDDFLWLDAATRLLLAVDSSGGVVVGRTLGNGRCVAILETFGELSDTECRRIRSYNAAHRYQPFAFTSFSSTGAREGTRVLAPEAHEDFVIFDMDVRDDAVAVVGTGSRFGSSGTPDYYFEPPESTGGTPLVPFDAYLAILDRSTGAIRHQRYVDLGRAEHLSSVRWTGEGLLAVGATDWNRWYGGMSVSRAAEPLLILDPVDDDDARARTFLVEGTDRHAHLFDVDVSGDGLVAVGPFDAPMTHSGDGGNVAAMSLGGMTLVLRRDAPVPASAVNERR